MMRNTLHSGNTLQKGLATLRERLPGSWDIDLVSPSSAEIDAVVSLGVTEGLRARLLVETKPRVTTADIVRIVPRLIQAGEVEKADGVLFISGFLTPLSRERLAAAGISYLDLAGNVRIQIDRPAVWIFSEGAERDPSPRRQGIRSLKGAKAGRLVRALCDWKPPVGVRELAYRAGVDPGYTSRVLAFLEEETVLERGERGTITFVRWRELLSLWARDYEIGATNRPVSCLAPRGLEPFMARLPAVGVRYAVTGAVAVPSETLVAPPARISCFVDDSTRAIEELGLVETDTGSNVLLLEPFDPVVYERGRTTRGLNAVALSQCVVDLLTGTGREPAQGDALLEWMERNEDEWRLS